MSSNPTKSKPKISARKRRANRLNSLKSTGPLSKLGKQIASANALQHGLLACHFMLLPGESEAALLMIRNELVTCFAPANLAELHLVEQIAFSRWKQIRLGTMQQADHVNAMVKHRQSVTDDLEHLEDAAAELDEAREQMEQRGIEIPKSFARKSERAEQRCAEAAQRREGGDPNDPNDPSDPTDPTVLDPPTQIIQSQMTQSAEGLDRFMKLGRYDQQLTGTHLRCLRELTRLQELRRKRAREEQEEDARDPADPLDSPFAMSPDDLFERIAEREREQEKLKRESASSSDTGSENDEDEDENEDEEKADSANPNEATEESSCDNARPAKDLTESSDAAPLSQNPQVALEQIDEMLSGMSEALAAAMKRSPAMRPDDV